MGQIIIYFPNVNFLQEQFHKTIKEGITKVKKHCPLSFA